MLELPELTPEHFEILVTRELRKIGLDVSELRTHRRSMLPEPDRGYLLELKGVLRRSDWQRRTLIACRRQQSPIGSVEVESLKEHLQEAEVEAGSLRRGRLRSDGPDRRPGQPARSPPGHGRPNGVRHERVGHTGPLSRLASRLLRPVGR